MKNNNQIEDFWFKLNVLHQHLGNEYIWFVIQKKKELLNNYNIDSGTDYADHIFNIAELLDFYNGN